MNCDYRTVLSYGEKEIIINKSRFIGSSKMVKSEEEALEFIDMVKIKYKDATHNVYAYVIGENSNIQRFSDDGEPSGTAGIPILELIKKEDLRNTVIVSTRYFGGIKLGVGGLIRAYTQSGKAALEAGKIIDMTRFDELLVQIDYNSYGKIENYLLNEKHPIKEVTFDQDVNINLYIELKRKDTFIHDIMDFTSGNGVISEIRTLHLPMSEDRVFI
ncbi:YigZ family protein [Tissierella creatinophila]|uniref:IMPACT family member YigZ n=1 Tax=Tissierella creatinophila DSM 6911 TaxID=1123403 RepID=A0A1U7M6E5_TISCR|nr:YigZ family protein [Tissierella creatinophila]OLS02856.1 IMPACT family member YigZ [Tissierella creatinophila DSM 6911]